jgi:hypothetical protein
MFSRREFLRNGVCAAVAGVIPGGKSAESLSPLPSAYFGLHPFIEANPKAVFIRRTRVSSITDEEAKRREGLTLAREIFVSTDRPGIPMTHRVILKPNVLSIDGAFYEGVVIGLKELGLRSLYFVEANEYHTWVLRGFADINVRHGVEMNECDRRARDFREGNGMTWSKVPDAVVYTRIPHYAPVNEPRTWLLNMAKWRSHGMCLTQAVKNEQGLVVLPYVRFCSGWGMVTGVPAFMKPDIHPLVERRVTQSFERHLNMGYARYQSRSGLSPIIQEIWAHKTLDNMSVLQTGFAMIEAIYPDTRTSEQFLSNLVMFSKDKFRLDLVGLYLGGHEPGNVHLYRIAKERGLSDTFNPWEVPIYEWVSGRRATPRKLTDFPRTPVKTSYLQLDGEPEMHLVNEPFDYDRHKI